jgi:hypothetical protein
MPLAWIHNLPKEEAVKLAMELGVPVQGTMDELRKRLKDKWRIVETYLPPKSKDKTEVAVHTAASSNTKVEGGDVHDHGSYFQMKLKGNVVTGLVKNIPFLSNTEPEAVFGFLVRASEIHRLNLVSDEEFLALLAARMTGRITQIFGVHLSASSSWDSVCSEILSIFLPPRIREGFLSRYVLDRFSQYASAAFLLPKPQGGYRMVIDYRLLNKKIVLMPFLCQVLSMLLPIFKKLKSFPSWTLTLLIIRFQCLRKAVRRQLFVRHLGFLSSLSYPWELV